MLRDDSEGKLVMEIPALVPGFGMESGQPSLGLRPIFRSPLLSGEILGSLGQALPNRPVPAGVIDLLPRGEGGEGLEAQVNPDLAIGNRMKGPPRFDTVAGKNGVPCPSFVRDRAGL